MGGLTLRGRRGRVEDWCFRFGVGWGGGVRNPEINQNLFTHILKGKIVAINRGITQFWFLCKPPDPRGGFSRLCIVEIS